MSGAIRREDPPPARNGGVYDWESIAATLQADPGEWYRVALCATPAIAGTTARHIRTSHYGPLHGGRYEAKARNIDGEHRVYARFLGPAEP